VSTDALCIKDKLWFLTRHYGNKAKLSIADVFAFPETPVGMRLELRPNALIGPLLSISYPDGFFNDPDCVTANDAFMTSVAPYILQDAVVGRSKDVAEKIAEVDILRHDVGPEPMLNETIFDFCRRNGIMHVTKRHYTYRKLLESRQNDYSFWQQLFEQLTHVPLLEVERHAGVEYLGNHKASIIIPCFNTESTIGKVLDSIAAQSLPPATLRAMEVVLVDDGSQIPVARAIDRKRYPFEIEIVRLEQNHGVSNARLLGVTHSTGDILVFLDSDVLPSAYYLLDHIARNNIVNNAVFISFKENVTSDGPQVSDDAIRTGLSRPSYKRDLRIIKEVGPDSIGNYKVTRREVVEILEETNYFKAFDGSRVFGVFDLSTMVVGHNFSLRRSVVLEINPFNKELKGWGMEDVYLGLRIILKGNFVIPVLSSGVYHLDHPPRSGSEEKKRAEKIRNTEVLDQILNSVFV
jgi:glycosyltransferase involved in cell wall biosynthesis